MKRLLYLSVLCIAIACTDDETPQHNFENNGIGNPYAASVIGIRKTIKLTSNGKKIDLDCNAKNQSDKNFAFEFYDDNTFHIYRNCDPDAEVIGIGDYTTKGDVLTLNLNGQTGKANMVYMGGDMLELRFTAESSGLFYNHTFTVLNM